MARDALTDVETDPAPPAKRRGLGRWVWHWTRWLALRILAVMAGLVLVFSVLNPPTTLTILQARRDHAIAPREWVPIDRIAPIMVRSVVAAEDANFCTHWGFDMAEIRKVIASGQSGGASTLTQQTAKNVYLWQGRSWLRKAAEAVYTPLIELFWSKRRITEVYLNVAEFGPGVFGVQAAAQYHFGTTADKLTGAQAARLAAILPAPKTRSTGQPTARSRSILDGALTIARDGRDSCLRLRD